MKFLLIDGSPQECQAATRESGSAFKSGRPDAGVDSGGAHEALRDLVRVREDAKQDQQRLGKPGGNFSRARKFAS